MVNPTIRSKLRKMRMQSNEIAMLFRCSLIPLASIVYRVREV